MRIKNKLQIMGGAVALLLAIIFLPMQTACAGTITDAYNRLSNYVTTSRPYNYITSSRAYNYVTNSRPYNYAVSGIGSIVKSASDLEGKGGYRGAPGVGGALIYSRITVTKTEETIPDTAALTVLRSSTNITKTPISNVSQDTSNKLDLSDNSSIFSGIKAKLTNGANYLSGGLTNLSNGISESIFNRGANRGPEGPVTIDLTKIIGECVTTKKPQFFDTNNGNRSSEGPVTIDLTKIIGECVPKKPQFFDTNNGTAKTHIINETIMKMDINMSEKIRLNSIINK